MKELAKFRTCNLLVHWLLLQEISSVSCSARDAWNLCSPVGRSGVWRHSWKPSEKKWLTSSPTKFWPLWPMHGPFQSLLHWTRIHDRRPHSHYFFLRYLGLSKLLSIYLLLQHVYRNGRNGRHPQVLPISTGMALISIIGVNVLGGRLRSNTGLKLRLWLSPRILPAA